MVGVGFKPADAVAVGVGLGLILIISIVGNGRKTFEVGVAGGGGVTLITGEGKIIATVGIRVGTGLYFPGFPRPRALTGSVRINPMINKLMTKEISRFIKFRQADLSNYSTLARINHFI
jgi:hypothetical protein